jgi:hypothetical protein
MQLVTIHRHFEANRIRGSLTSTRPRGLENAIEGFGLGAQIAYVTSRMAVTC